MLYQILILIRTRIRWGMRMKGLPSGFRMIQKKKYIKDERCIIDVDSVQYIYQWEMEWL